MLGHQKLRRAVAVVAQRGQDLRVGRAGRPRRHLGFGAGQACLHAAFLVAHVRGSRSFVTENVHRAMPALSKRADRLLLSLRAPSPCWWTREWAIRSVIATTRGTTRVKM